MSAAIEIDEDELPSNQDLSVAEFMGTELAQWLTFETKNPKAIADVFRLGYLHGSKHELGTFIENHHDNER